MKKKKEKVTLNKISEQIEGLAVSTARGFDEVHKKIDSVESGLNVKIDQLSSKFSGTNLRIDDLAMNRVKYEDHLILVKRVDVLENKVGKAIKK